MAMRKVMEPVGHQLNQGYVAIYYSYHDTIIGHFSSSEKDNYI